MRFHWFLPTSGDGHHVRPAEQRAYGDFLDHDARYERTEEFLAVLRATWAGRSGTASGCT